MHDIWLFMPSFNALRFSSLKMFLRLNIFSEQMFFCRIAAVDWIALFKRHSFATYKQTWLIDYGIAWNHFSVSFLNKTIFCMYVTLCLCYWKKYLPMLFCLHFVPKFWNTTNDYFFGIRRHFALFISLKWHSTWI